MFPYQTTIKPQNEITLSRETHFESFVMRVTRMVNRELRLTSTFNVALRPHAETMRTIRDRDPRTATSTFTQLLSSVKSTGVHTIYSRSSVHRLPPEQQVLIRRQQLRTHVQSNLCTLQLIV